MPDGLASALTAHVANPLHAPFACRCMQTVLFELGPLALSPAQVHSAVLAALLGADGADGYTSMIGGGGGTAVAAAAAAAAAADGLAELRQAVEEAVAEAVSAGGRGGGGGDGGVGSSGVRRVAEVVLAAAPGLQGPVVAEAEAARFAAGWLTAAGALLSSAEAAARAAAAQPLDWVPLPLGSGEDGGGGSGRGRGARGGPASRGGGGAAAAAAASTATDPLAVAAGGGAGGGGGGGAAGGGLAARLATELCSQAVEAGLRHYQAALPPRCPARVHASLTAAAVATLAATAPPGAAADAAAARLRAACAEAWLRGGRQQCSALSVTGRPCTRALHVSRQFCQTGINVFASSPSVIGLALFLDDSIHDGIKLHTIRRLALRTLLPV